MVSEFAAMSSLRRPESRLTLAMREWRCASCGAAHDRDMNAALNLVGSTSAAGRGDCAGPGSFVRSAREASTEDVLMLETPCDAHGDYDALARLS